MAKLVQRLVTQANDKFQVHFPYSAQLVAGIRTIPQRNFVKKTSDAYWEVPATPDNVAPLADFLSKHDFQIEASAAERLRALADAPRQAPPPEITGVMAGDELVAFRYRPRTYNPSVLDVVRSVFGARWDREEREWRLPFSRLAAETVKVLVANYGASTQNDLPAIVAAQFKRVDSALQLSSAIDIDKGIPVPFGLEYRGFQKAGIAYAAEKGSAIIGDEPGLGKTIQACGVANLVPEIQSVLVIVPSSLKANWRREWAKWSVKNPTIGVVTNGDASGWPERADVVIISHQTVAKHRSRIDARHWDLVVVDEGHRLKSPQAQRTQAILGTEDRKTREISGQIKSDRLLVLTGTPIVNRPQELWTLLRSVCPQRFNNFFAFAKRYCNATKSAYGWRFDGASNLDELQHELREHCMVRRLKKDVLSELPRKIRQIIPIENEKALRAERKALEKLEARLADLEAQKTLAYLKDDPKAYEKAVAQLRAARQFEFREMTKLRHETALAKIPQVVEMLHEELEDTDRKIILFAHHADVIDAYAKAFGSLALTLDGRVPLPKRQDLVDRFQSDPSIRVFIGGIYVAGVGYTLTAASLVAVAEPVWVPGDLNQAEDRAHRIGQTDSVQVWHIVVDGSIEQRMMEAVVDKQRVIDEAMDGAEVSGEPVDWEAIASEPEMDPDMEMNPITLPGLTVIGADELAAWTAERAKSPEERSQQRRNARAAERAEERAAERGYAAAAEHITPAQIQAVHAGLRALSEVCDGAKEEDGMGFNGCDTRVGKALAGLDEISPLMAAYAREMLRKYVGQLGRECIDSMWAAEAETAPGM